MSSRLGGILPLDSDVESSSFAILLGGARHCVTSDYSRCYMDSCKYRLIFFSVEIHQDGLVLTMITAIRLIPVNISKRMVEELSRLEAPGTGVCFAHMSMILVLISHYSSR